MRPILFAKDEDNFTSNGLGRLECASCIVTEERNGMYELEMNIYMSGNHASEIEMNSLIGAIPCDGGTIQAFRVYKITKPINGRFTVYARHISYDLTKIPCMPFSVAQAPSACANTLAGLKNNAVEECPFNFSTDVTTAGKYNQVVPASIRSRLGGVEGSVLDQFGGEYEWDNFNVILHNQRGRINTGISLRYGKNITDIKQEENIANTVTGIVPYWSDIEGETVVTLPENAVYSQNASLYPFHLTEAHDFSQLWDQAPSVSSLRGAAQAYVNKSGLGVPKVSIDVSFVALWDTEEYKDVAPLERVQLCDEVTVEFEKLGISAIAKVVRTEYDVLSERYNKIEIGSLRSTLAKVLNDQEADTIQTIDAGNLKVIAEANATAIDAINNATAWLTSANGYVVAVKNEDGSWKELLFMNTNDPTTAQYVLRINNNGLGFSTTGISGPYTNAWTIDGNLVASFITTGILKDHYNRFILDLDNGTLTLSTGTNVGEETLGHMQGRITANAEGITSEFNRATEAEGNLSSSISQTAKEIKSAVSSAQKTWDEENYTINYYGYGTAENNGYPASGNNGKYYLNASNGYLYLSNGSTWTFVKALSLITSELSAEISQTAKEIKSTVAAAEQTYDTENYTITYYGYGLPADNGYPASGNNNKYYLNQNNGYLYKSNNSSWVYQKTLERIVSQMQASITQNASAINAKVSKGDVSSQLSIEHDQIILSSGRLIISSGNFQIDAQGNITAKSATLSGTIGASGLTASDTDGWVRIVGSKIEGGRGSVGSNATWVNFANLVNGQGRVTEVRGRAVSLSMNELYVTKTEGSTNCYKGFTGIVGAYYLVDVDRGLYAWNDMEFVNGVLVGSGYSPHSN